MRTFVFLGAIVSGCAGTAEETPPPGSPDGPPAVFRPDAPPAVGDPGIAPPGFVAGEQPLLDGDETIVLAPGQTAAFRLDVEAEEHAAVSLWFDDTDGVSLSADRWDGTSPVLLGRTFEGAGKRFLSVLDPDDRRTYWFRVSSPAPLTATLRLERTPFAEGAHCPIDCARLLQMPLPNDPSLDGYAIDEGTVYRYWFGRRDLVMLTRHAARERALLGKAPFYPYDFSQWDGLTPGTDVGAPRHVSHQRGKDVDVSLYGSDELAIWRSFCTVDYTTSGRECLVGTVHDFDGYETARELAGFFTSGRVTMMFLDRELIAEVAPSASDAAAAGHIDLSLLPLYTDGIHLQHWPNHDNHVHVRVAETDLQTLRPTFEPP